MKKRKMKTHIYNLNIGNIGISESNNCIVNIFFASDETIGGDHSSLLDETALQIKEFLSGIRTKFNLPIVYSGSDFQRSVLHAIQSIPYGKTMSYSEVATKSGYPGSQRAVGTVCRNNKLPLVIPCHRVIKSNGEFGSYAGGSSLKKQLILMEKK